MGGIFLHIPMAYPINPSLVSTCSLYGLVFKEVRLVVSSGCGVVFVKRSIFGICFQDTCIEFIIFLFVVVCTECRIDWAQGLVLCDGTILSARSRWSQSSTVGTPYNTNVGVQKIPDRAIWKPVVAKRNNTNPWSCSEPQILVTRDSRQVHMAEQPASLMHSIQTAWQLFNLGQSIEIRIPHLLGHVGQLHTNVCHTFDSVSPCCKQQISRLSNRLTHAHSQSNLA